MILSQIISSIHSTPMGEKDAAYKLQGQDIKIPNENPNSKCQE